MITDFCDPLELITERIEDSLVRLDSNILQLLLSWTGDDFISKFPHNNLCLGRFNDVHPPPPQKKKIQKQKPKNSGNQIIDATYLKFCKQEGYKSHETIKAKEHVDRDWVTLLYAK